MKKQLLFGFLLSLISSSLLGQITLEHTYPLTGDLDAFKFTKLSVGDKYTIVSTTTGANYSTTGVTINIYNTNHSLFKSITVPFFSLAANSSFSSVYVYNISDNLFSTDSKVEYMVEYQTRDEVTSKYGSFVRIYNEDGAALFSKDSTRAVYIDQNNQWSVINTSGGTKMIIANAKWNDKSNEVYSLPGTLITAVTPNLKKNGGSLSNPVPNPSSDVAKVEFTLPEGITKGELSVYSMKGVLVKKFQVDGAFGYLLLDNSDLEPGTYFYKLETENNVAEIQKMLVIK